MQIITLNGQQRTINLTKYTNNLRKVSDLHSRAKRIIKEVYPCENVCENLPLPIYSNKTLYADFYLVIHRYIIEVQGEQHFKYVKYYHGSLSGFANSKKNDSLKEEWCELNNIELITFNYNETDDEWKEKL